MKFGFHHAMLWQVLSPAYNRIEQQAITKLLQLIQLSIQMLPLVACVRDR